MASPSSIVCDYHGVPCQRSALDLYPLQSAISQFLNGRINELLVE